MCMVAENSRFTFREGSASYPNSSIYRLKPSSTESFIRTYNTLETHTFFFQIMVTFLSYISNACHSLSWVAERL